ncbi:MLO-like protein 15 [Syzygium oleosum]|uniref:MLO-like protein 15 n=1 Tax=Syzygium oleosum TaxID=219896 RepID=UPI0024BA2937|nr:MLO-like protein 15 [Syzygium oleosum]
MAVAGGDETSLEYTPTWVVALVCFSIVFISITVDRFYHCAGQRLKQHKWWPLTGASRKIKDDLMLLGLISLLLTVVQNRIGKICISERLDNVLLPCKKSDSSSAVANFTTSSFASSETRGRRLLAAASDTMDYCSQKGEGPFLSVEAVHQLDIFIFVLATFHVVLCVLKVIHMILQWSNLEIYDKRIKKYDIQKGGNVGECILLKQCLLTKIREHYNSRLYFFRTLEELFDDRPNIVLHFALQLLPSLQKAYTSLTEYEYMALRQNFMACDPKDPGKGFQKYLMKTLRKDFEKMMVISWYSWLVAVIYLLVNVAGKHIYAYLFCIVTISKFVALKSCLAFEPVKET